MEKEVFEFARKEGLRLFEENNLKKGNGKSIFKTKDAKAVYNKAIHLLEKKFVFNQTIKMLDFFGFISNAEEIKKRQEYFKSIKETDNSVLRELKSPRPFWSPEYDIVVVTEDENSFSTLKENGIPVKYLITESDVAELEERDIVQVINCENFSIALERLPQAVFLNDIGEAYLERHLRFLSGWKDNLEIIKKHNISGRTGEIVSELFQYIELIKDKDKERLTRDLVEQRLEIIKKKVGEKVKEFSISGDLLIDALSKGLLPDSLKSIVRNAIKESGLNEELFTEGIPVKIDEKELERELRKGDINRFADDAERIRKIGKNLSLIPKLIDELEKRLIVFDFEAGISKWKDGREFPEVDEKLEICNSLNEFLDKPKAIGFLLDNENRASILTGANSGGKTTLLEHIIQIITYMQIGLPLNGKAKMPLFSEIYYFAKNKGSMSKGAFETLLTQMSEIEPGDKTLILADEIEAVTEPGVAGKMISATAEYFLNKKCYMIIATHLGQEIQKILPVGARIDGIEARGLDTNNELIVEHNPVLGKLASSTPELIVEKMAKNSQKDYFQYLNNYIKSKDTKQT